MNPSLLPLGFCIVLGVFSPATYAQVPVQTPAAVKPGEPYPDPPAELPGRGLAQHDFIYAGQWDVRKPEATLFLVQDGRVAWTYQIPTKDETNGKLSEFSDIHRLSNGDIVFAYKTGWRKIDATGKTLHDYKCPKITGPDGADVLDHRGQPAWTECHSAQPIGHDRVLFMQNGMPAKLFLYNLKTGQMEMERVMKTREPVDARSIHGQFRNVRMTKAGTFLIPHMNLNKVVEYDRDWNEIWSCEAPNVWHAARLHNGNTLISGNQHAFVREIDPKGKVVWEVKQADLPGIRLNGVHQAIRLASGNTVICNWTTRVNRLDWHKIVQLIEVTPEKKVVWAVNAWTDPDLGPASCIQILSEPGAAEDLDLMR